MLVTRKAAYTQWLNVYACRTGGKYGYVRSNCLEKIYKTRLGGNQVQALWDVSFSVEQGEYVAIMGESGSGKTTLLNILAALDRPTSGSVLLDGCDVTDLPEKEISKFRRDHLGFVFQDFNLLDTFSLRDNIYLPMVLAGKKPEEMKAKAETNENAEA